MKEKRVNNICKPRCNIDSILSEPMSELILKLMLKTQGKKVDSSQIAHINDYQPETNEISKCPFYFSFAHDKYCTYHKVVKAYLDGVKSDGL